MELMEDVGMVFAMVLIFQFFVRTKREETTMSKFMDGHDGKHVVLFPCVNVICVIGFFDLV